MYAFENDLRYQYSIRAFSGNGSRNFILLRKRVGTFLSLEAKYSVTRYQHITQIGSGLDSFSGRLVREVRAQVIVSL